jgi:hypothetical protein
LKVNFVCEEIYDSNNYDFRFIGREASRKKAEDVAIYFIDKFASKYSGYAL